MRRIVIPAWVVVWAGGVLALVALLLVVLALAQVARERDARVESVIAAQVDTCERGNALREVLASILVEARELRRQEGGLSPVRDQLYRTYIARVGPIDCAALPREGGP